MVFFPLFIVVPVEPDREDEVDVPPNSIPSSSSSMMEAAAFWRRAEGRRTNTATTQLGVVLK